MLIHHHRMYVRATFHIAHTIHCTTMPHRFLSDIIQLLSGQAFSREGVLRILIHRHCQLLLPTDIILCPICMDNDDIQPDDIQQQDILGIPVRYRPALLVYAVLLYLHRQNGTYTEPFHKTHRV